MTTLLRYTLIGLLISIATTMWGQLYDGVDMPRKFFSINLGFGPRTLDTDPGVIYTSYTDDSPSQDNFEGNYNVEDSYSQLGVNFGVKWGKYNGLTHKIFFDISSGENVGGIFGYALGYNISKVVGNGILSINPSIYGGFANYGFGVGSIENNSAYIQVGETQFYDNSLDLNLKSQVLQYGPDINIVYSFYEHLEAWVDIAYDIASDNSRPSLEFLSSESSASVDIGGTNPVVTYNGEPIESLPYDASGLRLTVGVSYVWNRY